MKQIFIFLLCIIIFFTNIESKHFVVISKPGSGKGTFSNYMAKKYNYVHIGLGDLTRSRKDNNQSTSLHILNKILKTHIEKTIKKSKQFILDNAITSKSNWHFWETFFHEKMLFDDIYFLVLDASDTTCISRMKDRLICKNCFNVCKKTMGIPITQHICKDCGNKLTIRQEDHDSKFLKQRFEKYHQIIEPIIKKLEKSYKVIRISSEQPLQDLYTIYDKLHHL